jgi:hypothetical protein
MLTERDRNRAHGLAAEWLESSGERHALVLAEHLERSGEKHRAVVWYLWAAEQALEGNDLAGVLTRAERGIQCGASGTMLGELTLLKAEASGWAGSRDHFALASSAFELLPAGTAAWARAGAELVAACRSAGDDARLRTTAAALGDAKLPAMVSIGHAWAGARTIVELLGAGERILADRLLPWITTAIDHADEPDVPPLRTMVEWLRAASELHDGKPGALLGSAADITRTFETAGHARFTGIVALQAAIASAETGDHKTGATWAERAGDAARRLGLRAIEVRSRTWLAHHLSESGHVDAALTTVRSAVRDAEGDVVASAEARKVLARIEERQHRPPAAAFEESPSLGGS